MNPPDQHDWQDERGDRRGGGHAGLRALPDAGPARVPPSSAQAEEALLSCILLDGREIMAKCVERGLKARAFRDPRRGTIFARLLALHAAEQPLELAVLAEELGRHGELDTAGGLAYLTEIGRRVPTVAEAGYFLKAVHELWLRRAGIDHLTLAVEALYDPAAPLAEALEPLGAKVARMIESARGGAETMVARALAARARTENEIAGRVDRGAWITSGLAGFEMAFGPIDPNNEDWLNLTCAVSSGGKSAWERQRADHNLREGRPGMAFLLETSTKKWLELAACTACGIDATTKDVLPADLEERLLGELALRYAWIGAAAAPQRSEVRDQRSVGGGGGDGPCGEQRLWIYDESLTVEMILARIDEHARRGRPLKWVLIDHLHELRSMEKRFRGFRQQEIAYCAQALKRKAKELNVPFFAPAQLNRGPGKEERRPTKFDIRDSGEIENAADTILHIWAPPKIGEVEQGDTKSPIVEFVSDKRRNGATGIKRFRFEKRFTRFVDLPRTEGKPDGAAPGAQNVVPFDPTSKDAF